MPTIVGCFTAAMCFVGNPDCYFFFNDAATPAIYTLSLHDALPICVISVAGVLYLAVAVNLLTAGLAALTLARDRKSTRLNSSHRCISYAVFCLKKKKKDSKI